MTISTESPDILVVDDDELMRSVAVDAINKLGHVAVGRADADGALEVLKTVPTIQVVLSDICLAAGTGPDLVRRALRDRPELKVVFMTGGFDNIAFRRTDPVLNKPFGLECLRKAIDRAFNEASARQESQPADIDRRRPASY